MFRFVTIVFFEHHNLFLFEPIDYCFALTLNYFKWCLHFVETLLNSKTNPDGLTWYNTVSSNRIKNCLQYGENIVPKVLVQYLIEFLRLASFRMEKS